jgi:gliding motility-associated-like protein
VNPSPIAAFSNTTACVNSPIDFTDNSTISSGSIVSWYWDFGDGSIDSTDSIQNPSHIYSQDSTYSVVLIVQSDLGCTDSVMQMVEVYPGPDASFTVSGDLGVGSMLTFTNTSVAIVSSFWDFGDGIGTSVEYSPTYTYSDTGNYVVTLIVWGEHNCPDTAILNLSIQDNEIYPPIVPTGFSPNGDGQNDVLYVRGGPFKYLEFKIFNNWGQEIFSTNDASKGWDGTWKNFDQPVDVYLYTIIATTIDDLEYKMSGSVTLIR